MSSDSQGRLRSQREEEKVMNNRKSQKSRPSPELANEIVSTTLEKNRWAEQMKYLSYSPAAHVSSHCGRRG